MNPVSERLVSDVELAAARLNLPAIREVVLPERMLSTSEADAKHDKFGLVLLEDSSCGFFYRLFNTEVESAEGCREIAHQLAGNDVTVCRQLIQKPEFFAKGLAIGICNAVAQHLLAAAGLFPARRPKSQQTSKEQSAVGDESTARATTPVGWVGYFTPNMRRHSATSRDTIVIELDQRLHQQRERLLVTGDMRALRACDPVYCTASTLVNETLDKVASHVREGATFELIGPSGACIPDPLFAIGVTATATSRVTDPDNLRQRLLDGQPWGEAVEKYSLTAADWPGIDALIEQARV